MYAQQLGFTSSWKMLTRDAGWLKPLCILTLVGWIPILGQIVVLGYAYEWARLTAWGVDATPKQHGVDYGKVLATGGRAFLVMLTMSIVIGVVLSPFFHVGLDDLITTLPFTVGSLGWYVFGGMSDIMGPGMIGVVLGLLVGTVLLAAMMRATLYDSFSAGWRIDRIAQMIGRDAGGFFKTFAVSLLGALVILSYGLVCLLVFGVVLLGGFVAVMRDASLMFWHGGMDSLSAYAIQRLLSLGVGPVLLVVLLVILAIFVYGLVANAMQLVAINACGQWFCRFAVDRWGVSSDPLPDGVPVGHAHQGAPHVGTASAPVPPAERDGDAAGWQPADRADASATAGGASSYWDDPDDVVPRGGTGASQTAGVPEEPGDGAVAGPVGAAPAPVSADVAPAADAAPTSEPGTETPSAQDPVPSAAPAPAPGAEAPAPAPASDGSAAASDAASASHGPILLGPVQAEDDDAQGQA